MCSSVFGPKLALSCNWNCQKVYVYEMEEWKAKYLLFPAAKGHTAALSGSLELTSGRADKQVWLCVTHNPHLLTQLGLWYSLSIIVCGSWSNLSLWNIGLLGWGFKGLCECVNILTLKALLTINTLSWFLWDMSQISHRWRIRSRTWHG
jgi:hypothetical protein